MEERLLLDKQNVGSKKSCELFLTPQNNLDWIYSCSSADSGLKLLFQSFLLKYENIQFQFWDLSVKFKYKWHDTSWQKKKPQNQNRV